MKQFETISKRDVYRLALKAIENELDFFDRQIKKYPYLQEFLTGQREENEAIRKELVKVLASLPDNTD